MDSLSSKFKSRSVNHIYDIDCATRKISDIQPATIIYHKKLNGREINTFLPLHFIYRIHKSGGISMIIEERMSQIFEKFAFLPLTSQEKYV